MRRVAVLIATAAGAGYVPVAPGTAGSAVGLAIYFLTRHWSPAVQVAGLAAISLLGVWASYEAARHFQKEDPRQVVIDEVAGQLLTLLLLGAGVVGAVLGFLMFRVLDVLKPWPASRLEALPGGWGIMADDLMAGVYGWLLLRAAAPLLSGIW
jgi:phosphatidylglycerophosphatase A